MSGDFSRKTFIPQKHYSGVLMQQGRVQLDADWNEQLAIHRHRTEIEALDVIGTCGVPQATDGLKIGETPDGTDLTISPGRIYVDGLLCELEATPVSIIAFVQNNPTQAALQTFIVDGRPFQVGQWVEIWADDKPNKILLQIVDVDPEQNILTLHDDIMDYQSSTAPKLRRVTTYMTQPDYPHPDPLSLLTSPPTSPPSGGTYVVFLDVWQRDVTALDDPHIREVALGGPDTTTRVKNVWQVHLLPVSTGVTSPPTSPPSGEVTCHTPFAEWDQHTAPSTGTLNARTIMAEDPKNPCLLPPSSGYRRLENQLYRVEVHTGGSRDQATFKWSRDNASVETTIEMIDGDKVTVTDIGKDDVLGFADAQWVEIVDDESELKGTPHPLLQIEKVNPATREITLQPAVPAIENGTHLKLRRWDQTGLVATTGGVKMVQGWIDLEDGVQVLFSEGHYHPGDYWLIPARTATGEIEWPPFEVPNEQPIPQPPLGIRHHYCRLALLEVHGSVLNLTDCRELFPSLTDICAEDVCFDNTRCKLPGVKTVQDALDQLCQAREREPGIHITAVNLLDGSPLRNDIEVPVTVFARGLRVLCDGDLDRPSVRNKPVCFVTLDLPFPFNSADRQLWGQAVIGFQPLILAAAVNADNNAIFWRPVGDTQTWLVQQLFTMMTEFRRGDRVLAHLTLKGNFIWAQQDPALFLDGEAFGIRLALAANTDLRLPSGDGRRGGDFEMWFWLVPPSSQPVTLTSLTLEPRTVRRGSVARGTITLSGPAPAGGTLVTLSTIDQNRIIANIPPNVTVPQGQTTAGFQVTIISQPFSESTRQAQITASLAGVARTETLILPGEIG